MTRLEEEFRAYEAWEYYKQTGCIIPGFAGHIAEQRRKNAV